MAAPLGCDVLVVGGGSGGCVVAGRLAAESDARVILVEAGPDYGARASGRWPEDLLDGGALVTSHDWGYGSGPIAGREQIAFPRARVIGGCSSHNGCVVAVGCPEDYDGWAALAGDGRWSSAAVRPALARALERLAVRTYADDEVGPFHRACLAAAAELGLPRADDLDDLDGGVGFGIEPVNVDEGVRVNASFAYVDPARGRENFSILDSAFCDRLHVDERRHRGRRPAQRRRGAHRGDDGRPCCGLLRHARDPATLGRRRSGSAPRRRDRSRRRPAGGRAEPARPPARRGRVRGVGAVAGAARGVLGRALHARGADARQAPLEPRDGPVRSPSLPGRRPSAQPAAGSHPARRCRDGAAVARLADGGRARSGGGAPDRPRLPLGSRGARPRRSRRGRRAGAGARRDRRPCAA